nr:hypothetical protein [Tanacetum cinerariifolium]
MYCREKSVATGANTQPIWTCYDCGEQNRCPKKVKKEEVGEARGRAYAIKDAEPQALFRSAGLEDVTSPLMLSVNPWISFNTTKDNRIALHKPRKSALMNSSSNSGINTILDHSANSSLSH